MALYAQWAAAVLYNGLARYQEAAAAARQATSNTFDYFMAVRALSLIHISEPTRPY